METKSIAHATFSDVGLQLAAHLVIKLKVALAKPTQLVKGNVQQIDSHIYAEFK